jgi:hydrogenase nickel incorporation protein HypA/HybF
MHELSIAQSIVEIVEQYAPAGRSVQVVRVALGQLSGVVPESLEFCFQAVVSDSPFEGARLQIDEIPLRARCQTCGTEFPVEWAVFVCGNCSGTDLEILSGTELKVTEIELAEESSEVV